MKKSLSLLLVAVMILSVAVFAVPASAKMNDIGVDAVEAYYFKSAPTIDGYVTTAEWGDVTFSLVGNTQDADVATVDDKKPVLNRFFYYDSTYGDANVKSMSYEVWLRWDENYFYVAAKVKDPDGFSLKNGKRDTWNGDAIQFRVDPEGPNSSCYNEAYDQSAGTPWANPGTIPDFVAGYVQIAGGFFDIYDNTFTKGLTEYSKPAYGAVKMAVAPAGYTYNEDTANQYTTYEIAIPWKYIFDNANYENSPTYTLSYSEVDYQNNPQGGIGRELGMSLTVYNAEQGKSKYNAFLSWGSGSTALQTELAPKTCAGSNSVTLSATAVDPANATFNKYDPSLLEGSGLVLNPDPYGTYYDYLDGDIARENVINDISKLYTLTYDDVADLSYWGGEYNGIIVEDDAAHGNVVAFEKDANGNVLEQTYIDTRDGEMHYKYPLSYTIEFDIKYTGNEVIAPAYDSALYNWFGGASGYDYRCGYSFNNRKFEIRESNKPESSLPIASVDYNLEKDTWYNWKFQFDNKSCTVRLFINGENIFNIYDRYFYYSSTEHLNEGTLMLFRMMNTQCRFDNVKIYNFVNTEKPIDPPKPVTSGGGNTPVTTEKEGGDVIDNDISKNEDGTFSMPIYAKKEYKTAVTLSFNIDFDATKASIKEIKGLDEGDYKLEKKADGQYVLTITNLAKIKSVKTGDKIFEVIFQPTSADFQAADLGIKVKDAYRYTVVTGDTMMYIAIVAVVASLGCAAIVVTRRRKNYVR